jgi:hypothetical protein
MGKECADRPPEGVPVSDGVRPVDPLGQFRSENISAHPDRTQPYSMTASRPPSRGAHTTTRDDAVPLLAFVSETTLNAAATRSRRRSGVRFSPLSRIVRVRFVLAWAFMVRASQITWRSIRIVNGCFAVTRVLYARSRTGVTTVCATLRHAVRGLRERGAFGAADAMKIVNGELVSLWRALSFRGAAVTHRIRRSLPVVAHKPALPALSRSRRRVLQVRSWKYPIGLFVSGVAVGAILVTLAQTRSSGSARAVVVAASANQSPAPSSSGGTSIAAPTAAVSASPPVLDSPVSTAGLGSGATRSTVRAREASREDEPTRRVRFQGSLVITSRPGGAAIFMNGRHVGTTPLVLNDLPVGSRAVRLTLAGYAPWSRAVQVVAQQRTTVAATLQTSLGQ